MLKKMISSMILVILLFVSLPIEPISHAVTEEIEKMQKLATNEARASNTTTLDITHLITGGIASHSHIYKTSYDANKHWEECVICGIKREEHAHSYTRTWASGSESCEKNNYYTDACSCGYKIIGHKPCVWDESSYDIYNMATQTTAHYHSKKCKICRGEIVYTYYKNSFGSGKLYSAADEDNSCRTADGVKISCTHVGICATCKYNYTNETHAIITTADNKVICVDCGKEFGNVISVEAKPDNESVAPASHTYVVKISLKNGATFNPNIKPGLRAVGEPFASTETEYTSLSSDHTQATI